MNRSTIAIKIAVGIAAGIALSLSGCNFGTESKDSGAPPAPQAAPPPGPSAADAPPVPLAAPVPRQFLRYLGSKIASSVQVDTAGRGSTSITLTLPNGASPGQFLLAAVSIATVWSGASAASGAVVAPSNAQCAGAKNPNTCCTGNGSGTCDWTLVDSAACGKDLQVSVYSKPVQAGEGGQTNYSWNFTSGGKPSTFLGTAGATVFRDMGSKPIAAIAHQCGAASQTATAPSITAKADNTLDLLIYSITGDNAFTRPNGYSLIYVHPNASSGPLLTSDAGVIPKAGAASGDQICKASIAGDNVGFQIGLSPSH